MQNHQSEEVEKATLQKIRRQIMKEERKWWATPMILSGGFIFGPVLGDILGSLLYPTREHLLISRGGLVVVSAALVMIWIIATAALAIRKLKHKS